MATQLLQLSCAVLKASIGAHLTFVSRRKILSFVSIMNGILWTGARWHLQRECKQKTPQIGQKTTKQGIKVFGAEKDRLVKFHFKFSVCMIFQKKFWGQGVYYFSNDGMHGLVMSCSPSPGVRNRHNNLQCTEAAVAGISRYIRKRNTKYNSWQKSKFCIKWADYHVRDRSVGLTSN